MDREVSQDEVALLHQFCIKHQIKFYDVRLELVDHLASSIEELWKKEPNLSFEKALEKIYSTYGNMGFRNLMREKEIQVERSMFKGYKRVLALFFTLPHVLLSIAIMIIAYFFYRFGVKTNGIAAAIFVYVFLLCNIAFAFWIDRNTYKKIKRLKEDLIVLPYSRFFVTGISLIVPAYLMTDFLEFGRIDFGAFQVPAFFTLLIILLIIELILNIAFYYYFKQIYQEAESRYPGAFKREMA